MNWVAIILSGIENIEMLGLFSVWLVETVLVLDRIRSLLSSEFSLK